MWFNLRQIFPLLCACGIKQRVDAGYTVFPRGRNGRRKEQQFLSESKTQDSEQNLSVVHSTLWGAIG